MSSNWSGIFPAVTTKFNRDFSIDEGLTTRHIEHQIEAGVHGIIVSGSLGEASTLSQADKLRLIRLSRQAANDKVPVLTGLAERSTADAMAFAKAARDAGAQGFMLLPPMQYKSDPRETVHYLKTVAAATIDRTAVGELRIIN